jgi:hypothetical protein
MLASRIHTVRTIGIPFFTWNSCLRLLHKTPVAETEKPVFRVSKLLAEVRSQEFAFSTFGNFLTQ